MTGTEDPEVTVLLPCLDEARTVGVCVAKARSGLESAGISHEVLIADNGSQDGSREVARIAGARVITVHERGYGAALRGGIAAARGRYVIMADADDSYDLAGTRQFVEALRSGNDLVMGNRFAGGVAPGAMPSLHRYLGNPALSFIGRLFFRIPIRDFHCGMRGFDRAKAQALDLRSEGMEFASEMVVKFALAGHRIVEVPTSLQPDGRDRPPHLRSWRDGWRHLRFLLLFSPRWLFLFPGLLLTVASGSLMLRLALGPLAIGGATLDTQSLLFAGAGVAVGAQAVLLAILSRTYAAISGMLPPSRVLSGSSRAFTLERGIGLGMALLILGATGFGVAIAKWARRDFGPLQLASSMRLAIPSATFLVLGSEILLASFFLGLLHLDRRVSHVPAHEKSADQDAYGTAGDHSQPTN